MVGDRGNWVVKCGYGDCGYKNLGGFVFWDDGWVGGVLEGDRG